MSHRCVIEDVCHLLPETVLSSAEIEERLAGPMARLNFPKGLIVGLTGIRERRLWQPGFFASEAATAAARKLLNRTCVSPGDIGLLISTSVCKDYVEPSVASLVHGNLGLPPTCRNFDIGNACLGFMDAINTAKLFIESGEVSRALIVDAESSREPIETTIEILSRPGCAAETFHQNFATLTLGSGAAAMLLCRSDLAPRGHSVNGSVTLAATQHCRLCLGQKDRMIADAPSVMKFGVELAHATWREAARRLPNWSDATIDIYIPHQVSARNTRVLAKTLGINAEKAHLNYTFLGNIGPAAIPITLSMAQDEGRLTSGRHAALMGIGSGLNCTMMSVTW
ncbi:MAG: 3-oxoacyl-ACP synthase III [Thermodesulfobacteriota bacterium]